MAVTFTNTSAGTMQASGSLDVTLSGAVEAISADRTVTTADNGLTLVSTAVDLTVALPSSPGTGFQVTVIAGIASATTGLTITGSINGGSTSAVNTAATDAIGDRAMLVYTGSAWVATFTGTWAVT